MGTVDKQGVVTMQELMVSSLAQSDALTKLLIEKGLITEAEFMQKLSAERAEYQAMLQGAKGEFLSTPDLRVSNLVDKHRKINAPC